MNLRKIDTINIAKYTEHNWEELRHEWEEYSKIDTLCLGACLLKYNTVMKEVVYQNISNNLTAPSLSLKGWYYLYHYDKPSKELERMQIIPKDELCEEKLMREKQLRDRMRVEKKEELIHLSDIISEELLKEVEYRQIGDPSQQIR